MIANSNGTKKLDNNIMTNPLISFIIPVYRVEAYLRNCIDSIRNQSFEDWEMILIDDGSPDNSGAICDEFSSIDLRIKVIHQKNQGVAVARNQGLDAAQGDWIWFVDSDDYIVEGALQKLADTIREYECDTIFFGLLHDNDGVITNEHTYRTDIFENAKDEFLQQVFSYTNPAMLFSRSILQSQYIRFTKGIRMAEDLELQYKYLLFCQKPIQIADCLYIYQHREGSAMTNPQTHLNNMNDCLTVAANLSEFVRKFGLKEYLWFSLRIRQLIKGCLQSAEHLSYSDRGAIQDKLRKQLNDFDALGFKSIRDFTLKLACFNFNLYVLFLRVFYKLKGIR